MSVTDPSPKAIRNGMGKRAAFTEESGFYVGRVPSPGVFF